MRECSLNAHFGWDVASTVHFAPECFTELELSTTCERTSLTGDYACSLRFRKSAHAANVDFKNCCVSEVQLRKPRLVPDHDFMDTLKLAISGLPVTVNASE
jgi:hypothetical protein